MFQEKNWDFSYYVPIHYEDMWIMLFVDTGVTEHGILLEVKKSDVFLTSKRGMSRIYYSLLTYNRREKRGNVPIYF